MKRNMELVRELLLKIEKSPTKAKLSDLLADDATKDDLAELQYHLGMLVDEVGFVKGISAHTYGGKNWVDLELTGAATSS